MSLNAICESLVSFPNPWPWLVGFANGFNEDWAWLTKATGVLVMCIVSIAAGPWFSGFVETRKLKGRKRLDIKGNWTSTHNRMRGGVYNSQTGEWHTDQIRIKVKGGKYLFETVDQDSDMAWRAEGSLFKNDYVHGTWWEGVEGAMTLWIHPAGDSISGLYTGRNSNADGGEVRVGPWVMAKETKNIHHAKAWLDRTNILFRSDIDVEGIRRRYDSYHLTQMNGVPVWRHHVLRLGQAKASAVDRTCVPRTKR